MQEFPKISSTRSFVLDSSYMLQADLIDIDDNEGLNSWFKLYSCTPPMATQKQFDISVFEIPIMYRAPISDDLTDIRLLTQNIL